MDRAGLEVELGAGDVGVGLCERVGRERRVRERACVRAWRMRKRWVAGVRRKRGSRVKRPVHDAVGLSCGMRRCERTHWGV